jgi:hypothetical protein
MTPTLNPNKPSDIRKPEIQALTHVCQQPVQHHLAVLDVPYAQMISAGGQQVGTHTSPADSTAETTTEIRSQQRLSRTAQRSQNKKRQNRDITEHKRQLVLSGINLVEVDDSIELFGIVLSRSCIPV